MNWNKFINCFFVTSGKKNRKSNNYIYTARKSWSQRPII